MDPKRKYSSFVLRAKIDWLRTHPEVWELSTYDIAQLMKDAGVYARTTSKRDAGYSIAKMIEHIKSEPKICEILP